MSRGADGRCVRRSPNCSHKIEFSFLKGNLMVPAGHTVYFNCDGSAFGNGRCLYEYRRAVLRRDIENMKEDGS